MKRNTTNGKTDSFVFKFNKTTILLCVLGLLLCVAGIVASVWRIVNEGIDGVTKALQSPLLIGVCIFGIVVLLSMLIRSRYIVDEKFFTVQFGIVKSKTPIDTITAIELDKETDKLTVYCGESYSVISVNKDWNDEFVKALQAANPKAEYSIVLAKPKKENKEK